ncbi:hypothetical protein MTsPCn9_07240 [Croceitalea sp. MTPC9]|uniref:VWA domain-containing protein n=1 Tax=unclassified Croceitalea TaxID=2632280 RepID=UPI002B3A4C04|nr:hypothetical protein MTsPCn6_01470 [Croceitalea sp. MTPC6]GMN15788.1 hypothetical protein MTsPCn9_07240 [Croceitalea sp. MTPC9]
MQTSTVLLILLAAIVSLCFVLFQYFYKTRKDKTNKFLAFLRFVALFCSLLLLINPKFSKEEYYTEKPNLIVVSDNSKSILNLEGEEDVRKSINGIKSNSKLGERFDTTYYTFGSNISTNDTLVFNENNTDIAEAITTLGEIYNKQTNAVILIGDGNQTLGTDYEYLTLDSGLHVFPVVAGDTTSYEDLYVGQVIINKYAFLRNRFPVETSVTYSGNKNVSSVARIYLDGRQVFQQPLSFSKNDNAKTISATIKAENVGVKDLRVQVDKLSNEKNTANNVKEQAIEVIDEKTNVGIVSSIMHPDIGALKKSIETNEQREVKILKPNVSSEVLEDIDVFILYQPNTNFKTVFDFISNKGLGSFTITGSKTDWNFLNAVQSSFLKESYNQKEEVIPSKNAAFNLFDISDLSFEGYPPLESGLGDLSILKPYESIANQRIKGVELDTPLFLIINQEKSKEAVLFGENIWKWRVQTYRNERSFKAFDDFTGKLILFLSDVKQKSRLTVDYELVYDGSTNAKISASFFDNSYTFDPNASLILELSRKAPDFNREFPMLLKGNNYEFNLDGLEAGDYDFSITESKEKISKSERFKILDFNLENQFLSSNYKKLERFAITTGGKSYFPNQMESLINDLENDTRFTPVQKSNRNVVSLIDFRYLLFFIVLAFAAEWFIRKYNGLL